MKEILKEALIPQYKDLLSKINFKDDIYPFCMQWGNEFPKEERSGILFVGKATNGWISKSREIEDIFGESPNRIFGRGDQMRWVSRLESNTEGYNTRNSAFWRVIKRISEFKNGNEEWTSKIAWSNLYKLSLIIGNPTEALKKQQEEVCKKILETEISILNPKYVIFLTSGWEHNFVKYLIQDSSKKNFEKIEWGKYNTKGFLVNDVIYILSSHPQGKNENSHVNAIKEVIKRVEINHGNV